MLYLAKLSFFWDTLYNDDNFDEVDDNFDNNDDTEGVGVDY